MNNSVKRGRPSTSVPIKGDMLRNNIKKKYKSISDFARKQGYDNQWLLKCLKHDRMDLTMLDNICIALDHAPSFYRSDRRSVYITMPYTQDISVPPYALDKEFNENINYDIIKKILMIFGRSELEMKSCYKPEYGFPGENYLDPDLVSILNSALNVYFFRSKCNKIQKENLADLFPDIPVSDLKDNLHDIQSLADLLNNSLSDLSRKVRNIAKKD